MKLFSLGLTAMLMTTLPAGANTPEILPNVQPRPFMAGMPESTIWAPGGLSIDFGNAGVNVKPRKVTTVQVPVYRVKPLEPIDSAGVDPGDIASFVKIWCANRFIAEVETSRATSAATFDLSTQPVKVRHSLPEYWRYRFVPAPLYEYVKYPEAQPSDRECKG